MLNSSKGVSFWFRVENCICLTVSMHHTCQILEIQYGGMFTVLPGRKYISFCGSMELLTAEIPKDLEIVLQSCSWMQYCVNTHELWSFGKEFNIIANTYSFCLFCRNITHKIDACIREMRINVNVKVHTVSECTNLRSRWSWLDPRSKRRLWSMVHYMFLVRVGNIVWVYGFCAPLITTTRVAREPGLTSSVTEWDRNISSTQYPT